MRLRLTVLGVAGLLLLAGCGGGGATVATGPGPVQQVGPVSVEGEARVLAPTVASGGATLYALSGSITGIKMTDANPTLEETEVFFVAQRGKDCALMACSPDGSGLRVVASGFPLGPYTMKLVVKGGFVYFVRNLANQTLYRVKTSGGTPVQVKASIRDFTFNTSGSKIYGYQAPSTNYPNGRYVSMNPDGTGMAHLFAAPYQHWPYEDFLIGCLSDGSLVLCNVIIGSGTSYAAYSTGGVLWSSEEHPALVGAAAMENGTDLVYHTSANLVERFIAGGQGGWIKETLGPTNRLDYSMTVAPGGSKLGFATALQDVDAIGVWVDTPNGGNGKRLYQSRAYAVGWGDLVTSREFVGTGLPFASAGAFLFSEKGAVMPAVVWADATTRNTIQITKISGDGAQNVVYKLTCDDLKRLSYSNSSNLAPVDVVTTVSGIIGVLISMNSETGKVESLTTFKGAVNAVNEGRSLKVTGADTVFRSDGKVVRAPETLVFD